MTVPVLYLTSSQFSGSTLASFLLAAHPEIASIGHSMGWPFDDDSEFLCSCGAPLAECPLFRHVAAAFAADGLPFDLRDFGTAFRLADNPRLNLWLTETLPRTANSHIEGLRDGLLDRLPGTAGRLARQRRANAVLFRAVLDYHDARTYLDNSHSPHRMWRLARDPAFAVQGLHLVRDPRAVAWSIIKNSGWSADAAIASWLRRQEDAQRIGRRLEHFRTLHYEALCTATDDALAEVHRFVGIEPQAFGGDFMAGEHHILGNQMRFGGGSIRLDEQWRERLPAQDLDTVLRHLDRWRGAHRSDHPLSPIIDHYLERP